MEATSKFEAPQFKQFYEHLWPASISYASPITPIFLCSLFSPSQLDPESHYLVRDGLLPLISFFQARPEPQGFSGRLFVYKDLLKVVPRAWRDHVGSWTIVSESSKADTRSMLVTGIGSELFCSLESAKALLQRAKRSFKAAPRKKALFLPPKSFGFGMENKFDFHNRIVLLLSEIFGASGWDVLDYYTFETKANWDGFRVVELNDRMICGDSYLTHLPLQRGATSLVSATERTGHKKNKLVSLSPHHGYSLCEKPIFPSIKRDKSLERYLSKLNYPSSNHLWPRWLEDWSKTL